MHQALVSLFDSSYDSQGYSGGIRTRLIPLREKTNKTGDFYSLMINVYSFGNAIPKLNL
jgi:hypothetical protein